MPSVNLKDVAASGMVWNAFQKYTVLGVYFISSIILARLLTPHDYGCIGVLDIFIAVATIMIDGGFGSALLQKKNPTQEDYSTIFYWNLFISTLLYLVLFICAPLIADFYRIPLLSSVLRVQGLVLLINALKMVQSNQLRKTFRFKPIAITVLSSSIISVIVTIVMAYYGMGIWALVTQNLLIALLPMLAFWTITRWKPLLLFSRKSFSDLFNFGGFMFLTAIVNTISDNVQGLLIGRFYNASTMGYYSKAKTTESLASTGISQVIDSFALQLYAEVQNDLPTLRNIIKRLTGTLAYVTLPVIISLLFIAKPLFIILYSDRWLPCVPYFRILAAASLAVCLQAVNLQAIAAIGRSKTMFSWTLFKRVTSLLLIVVGLFSGGVKGMLWGMVLGTWVAYFINANLVSTYIGYKLRQQLLDLMPVVLIAICAIVPSCFLYYFIPSVYLGAIVSAAVFLCLYFGLSVLFKIESYRYCMDLVPYFLNKILKRQKQ